MTLLIPMTMEPQDPSIDFEQPATELSELLVPANAAFSEWNSPEDEGTFEALGR